MKEVTRVTRKGRACFYRHGPYSPPPDAVVRIRYCNGLGTRATLLKGHTSASPATAHHYYTHNTGTSARATALFTRRLSVPCPRPSPGRWYRKIFYYTPYGPYCRAHARRKFPSAAAGPHNERMEIITIKTKQLTRARVRAG